MTHPFWNFSIALYEKEGVEKALISLQDNHKFNVNLLLYCCWYANSGYGRLSKRNIKQLIKAIHHWHEGIVIPLRAARKKVQQDGSQAALRKSLLQQELEAERVEQRMLFDTFVNPLQSERNIQQKLSDAMCNIAMYWHALAMNTTISSLVNAVSEILIQAFPDIDPHKVVKIAETCLLKKKDDRAASLRQMWLDGV